MKHILAITGLAAVMAFGAAPVAFAAASTECSTEFNMADVDDNGKLSMMEAKKVDDSFMALDVDKDGMITQEEFRKCIEGIFHRVQDMSK